MSASHESSWARRVWRDWRPEILRGAFLFAIVASVGVFALRQVRAFEPLALLRERGVDFNHGGDEDRHWVDAYTWSGMVDPGGPVWIRNLNGAIMVEHAHGDSVEVTAQKSWRHGDPESVQIVAVPGNGGVTLCALWHAATSECGAGGVYRMKGGKGGHGDVAVRFLVRLPEGVRLDATTVNGNVTASGTEGTLVLETVNGSVTVEGAIGSVTASTVNGSVTADVLDLAGATELVLETVNGSITASLPADIDAQLEASTVNGKVQSELPLHIVGRINPRSIRATLGSGGMPLRLKTVNGSVTIVPAGAAAAKILDVVEPVPPAPPASPAPHSADAPAARAVNPRP